MSASDSPLLLQIPVAMQGLRTDKAIAQLLPQYSRATIQQWLAADRIQAEGVSLAQNYKLVGGETVTITLPPSCRDAGSDANNGADNGVNSDGVDAVAQAMPLHIIAEDAALLIIDKPAGLVVHPGAGNPQGTLLNGLLHHRPQLAALPRAGLVHRLDKNTTGLMVVAKTHAAHEHLLAQLKNRTMHRQYHAVVEGVMISGETIDQPIGRHPHHRTRMAVVATGKPAITRLRVHAKYRAHCLLQADLDTGRTHQIRVHLSWRGYRIVGDTTYGYRGHCPPAATPELRAYLQQFARPALHALKLSLQHPTDGDTKTWHSPLPPDLCELQALLRADANAFMPQ